MAELTGAVWVYEEYVFALHVRFVHALVRELAPRRVHDCFGQVMVSEHACNIQLLQDQRIAFFEDSVNELVLPVLTLTSNMQVNPRQL